jgi:hypothetical protein
MSKKVKPKATSLEKLVLLKDQITELYEQYDAELQKAIAKYGEGDFWYEIDDEEFNYMKVSLVDNLRKIQEGEPVYTHKKVNAVEMEQRAVKREPKETHRICS